MAGWKKKDHLNKSHLVGSKQRVGVRAAASANNLYLLPPVSTGNCLGRVRQQWGSPSLNLQRSDSLEKKRSVSLARIVSVFPQHQARRCDRNTSKLWKMLFPWSSVKIRGWIIVGVGGGGKWEALDALCNTPICHGAMGETREKESRINCWVIAFALVLLHHTEPGLGMEMHMWVSMGVCKHPRMHGWLTVWVPYGRGPRTSSFLLIGTWTPTPHIVMCTLWTTCWWNIVPRFECGWRSQVLWGGPALCIDS